MYIHYILIVVQQHIEIILSSYRIKATCLFVLMLHLVDVDNHEELATADITVARKIAKLSTKHTWTFFIVV